MKFKEVKGDLIKNALNGDYDVIAHGCNCFCTQGAGIALQMKNTFDTHKYPMEASVFKGDINKLGTIGSNSFDLYARKLFVVNAYTQFEPGKNLDHVALSMCMKKINYNYKGMRIGLPLIGCGIAGGIWDFTHVKDPLDPNNLPYIKNIILDELTDMDVTIVHYEK